MRHCLMGGAARLSQTPRLERVRGTTVWQQKANEAEHQRPRGSSARLSTGKATRLELQSAGARFAPRE